MDICGILNVHSEGLLAHSSLLSLHRAKKAAEACGLNVELLVVADCPDQKTREYLSTARDLGARTIEVSVDDLGLARNEGVAAARGRYVAFLDGDDLCSDNWFALAFEAAERDDRNIVWHPEANLYFGVGQKPRWRLHPDMDELADDWMRLAIANLWTSLAFTRRELFQAVPYRKTDLPAQFGYEDWTWNAETISRGMLHKVVPGTAHLLRLKAKSLGERTSGVSTLASPTELFRQRLEGAN